ncbi:FAD-binding oxidoreductase [Kibdelosporangium philippinense]|uniref:FAD-binding oxidoreductase n=1 Tax=Kibdelosporangium philippinense TaxID=211113 RepID=A0ABS8ZPW2_9PSEU|nr:FAD-binding oxidoreductase [Kibdelosporangium philippinense]MCE7008508.1 FAD-binding oxidoreductase [Kibdelosporangium philippinense]
MIESYQLLATHKPAVVVHATSPADIQDAVRQGGPIAVHATGHGMAAPLDGTGVLICTQKMTSVRVSAVERTAWIEAGARWRHVIEAAAPHGLAPLSGSLPSVGAVSYTLGGGIGLMARRYGFAADHVRRIDLVTADGRLRQVTQASDPDLFWALRGGGGNFGVVTGMEIDLMPVDRIYGGALVFDLKENPEIASTWYQWTSDVPEEMTSACSMMTFPDGRQIAQIQIAYLGTEQDGDELLRPLGQGLKEVPYAESEIVFNEPDQPHPYRGESILLKDLDPARLTPVPAGDDMCVIGLRHLGGALAREPKISNAVGHRTAGYALGVLSPADTDRVRAVHSRVLNSWSDQTIGRCLNFTFGAITAEQVAAAFEPQDFHRLCAIRAAVDPAGIFRANFPL